MEQIERTRRYLNRIREIYSGVLLDPKRREDYVDDVHSFFVHCYHIADWIAELNKLGITREQVHSFVRSHRELEICRDFCNATKHCRLKSTWTGRDPHVVRRTFETTSWGGKEHTTKGKFEILVGDNGEPCDALELAERCMKLWDEFVAQLGQGRGELAVEPERS